MSSRSSARRTRDNAAPAGVVALLAAIAIVGAAGLALAVTAAAPAPQPISKAAPVKPPPLPPGPTPDLELLFSAQVAGWVEPCG